MPTLPRRVASVLVAALLLGSTALGAAAAPAPTVSFTSARAKAAREGKVLLVGFTAAWCLPCRVMAETTFADPEVLAYLREHYVSIEIDVENFDGLVIQQQYEVESLPTILIFSSGGEEVDRLTGSVSAEQLLVSLRQNNLPQNRPRATAPDASEDWSEPFARMTNVYAQTSTQAEPTPSGKTSPDGATGPSGKTDLTPATPASQTRPEAIAPAAPPTFEINATPPDDLAAASPNDDEYPDEDEYEVTPAKTSAEPTAQPAAEPQAEPHAPQAHYTLQLGAFTSEANAATLAETLRQITPHPIQITADDTNAPTIYRVTLRQSGTEAWARTQQADMAARGMDSVLRRS